MFSIFLKSHPFLCLYYRNIFIVTDPERDKLCDAFRNFFLSCPCFLPFTLLFGFLVLCFCFSVVSNSYEWQLTRCWYYCNKNTRRQSFKKDIHCKDDFLTLSVVLNHHNQHVETNHRHYQCLELWAVDYIEQLRLPFYLKPKINSVKFSY